MLNNTGGGVSLKCHKNSENEYYRTNNKEKTKYYSKI